MIIQQYRRQAPDQVDLSDLGSKALCGLLLLDDQGRILAANEYFAQIVGHTADAVIGRRLVEFLAPGSRVLYEAQFGPLLLIQGQIAEIALDMEAPDSSRVPVLLNAKAERAGKGLKVIRLAMITAKDRRHYETELLAERRRAQQLSDQLNDVLESTTDAVLAVDRDWRLTFTNGHAALLLGAERSRNGQPLLDALEAIGGADARSALKAAVAEGIPTAVDLQLNQGQQWLDCHVYPGQDGARFFLRDVTDRRRAEEDLRSAHAEAAYRASHDALTGLLNRAAFTAAVADALQRYDRVVIALIDLDRFKHVNDTLGHAAGDALLQAVAERMREAVRLTDVLARLGGDEFTVMIETHYGDRERVVEFAARLCEAIGAPYTIDGHDVSIGASIGMSMAPEHGATFAELYHHADIALYRVKENGRNAVRLFDEALRAEIVEQGAIGEDLREALATAQVSIDLVEAVGYQDAEIVGAVLLPTWGDPRHGRLGSGEVQQVAIDTGFAHELSRHLAGAIGLALVAADAPAFIALPVHQPLLLDHLRDDLITVAGERGIDPSRCRVILQDKAAHGDVSALDQRVGVLKALGFPIDLGAFPGPQRSLGVLDSFAFDGVWMDFNPNECDAIDLRRLAVDVALRRGLSAFFLRAPTR